MSVAKIIGVRGGGGPSLAMWAVGAAARFLQVLLEIFDESAYSRFLARTQGRRSRESYGEFLRENELAKARRPRCC